MAVTENPLSDYVSRQRVEDQKYKYDQRRYLWRVYCLYLIFQCASHFLIMYASSEINGSGYLIGIVLIEAGIVILLFFITGPCYLCFQYWKQAQILLVFAFLFISVEMIYVNQNFFVINYIAIFLALQNLDLIQEAKKSLLYFGCISIFLIYSIIRHQILLKFNVYLLIYSVLIMLIIMFISYQHKNLPPASEFDDKTVEENKSKLDSNTKSIFGTEKRTFGEDAQRREEDFNFSINNSNIPVFHENMPMTYNTNLPMFGNNQQLKEFERKSQNNISLSKISENSTIHFNIPDLSLNGVYTEQPLRKHVDLLNSIYEDVISLIPQGIALINVDKEVLISNKSILNHFKCQDPSNLISKIFSIEPLDHTFQKQQFVSPIDLSNRPSFDYQKEDPFKNQSQNSSFHHKSSIIQELRTNERRQSGTSSLKLKEMTNYRLPNQIGKQDIQKLFEQILNLEQMRDSINLRQKKKSINNLKIGMNFLNGGQGVESMQEDKNMIEYTFIEGKSFFNLKIICCEIKHNLSFSTDIKENEDAEQVEPAILVITEDISNQIYLQKLQKLNQSKKRMVASISHELRTPLNCSIGLLDLLSSHQMMPQQLAQEYLFPALCSNRILLHIVNDILDLSQIDSGKFQLQFKKFDISEIMKECLSLFILPAQAKNIKILLNIDEDVPSIVNSDPQRIKQIMMNLISNSLKYTQKGSIKIRVQNINEELLLVSVEDTGIGIKPENIKFIFEQFGRVNSIFYFKITFFIEKIEDEKILDTEGAGLGLTISMRLAKGIGGNREIEVQSEQDKGTIFSFYIKKQESQKRGASMKQGNSFDRRQVQFESYTRAMNSVELKDLPQEEQDPENYYQNKSQWDRKEFSPIADKTMNNSGERDERQTSQRKQVRYGDQISLQQQHSFDQNNQSSINQQIKRLQERSSDNLEEIADEKMSFDGINVSSYGVQNRQNKYQQNPFIPQQASSSPGKNQVKSKSILKNQGQFVSSQQFISFQQQQQQQPTKQQQQQLSMSQIPPDSQNCNCVDILIAEDSQYNTLILKMFLKNYNLFSDEAGNGQIALDLVISKFQGRQCGCTKGYKLILMDIDMPIKNGFEATEDILSYCYNNNLPPPLICACSALIGDDQKYQAKQKGMSMFITKPIDKDHLLSVLKKANVL